MKNRSAQILKRLRRVSYAIVAIGMVMVLCLSIFSSCASGNTNQETLKGVYSESRLGDFASNLSLTRSYLARQYFTAAVNGYDMLADGFNDADLEAMRADEKYYKPGEEGVNLDAAKKVLLEKDQAWSVRPDGAGEEYERYVNELTEAEAKQIVSNMAKAINTQNDSGWDSVMRGIGTALKWISDHLAFHSYLLALFIFAVALELIMLPLGIRQQKNSIKQAKLRPKEMAIRNKYKGRTDQVTMQKMQAEIQELYQKENFNPMGGCLPLLIQLPIVFILYYIVIDPLHYMMGLSTGVSEAISTFATTARAAGGMGITITSTNRGTIEVFSHIGEAFLEQFRNFSYYTNTAEVVESIHLSELPNFNIGSVNFGLVPQFLQPPYALMVIPVLTFVVYFGSMKLTRKLTYQAPSAQDQQMGCSNKVMDIMMPLFSVWISFTVPAVVGVYWIFKSLLSTVKQFVLSRVLPVPVFTEEDYKAAAKEMGGKAPKPVKKYNGATGNPRVRSLHHIDDEDFEDTRAKAERRREAEEELEEYERPSAPKTPESTKEEIEKARLKLGKAEEKKKRHREDEAEAENTAEADVQTNEADVQTNEADATAEATAETTADATTETTADATAADDTAETSENSEAKND